MEDAGQLIYRPDWPDHDLAVAFVYLQMASRRPPQLAPHGGW
jgi:hypothetical protein